jgi:hypothetical protein
MPDGIDKPIEEMTSSKKAGRVLAIGEAIGNITPSLPTKHPLHYIASGERYFGDPRIHYSLYKRSGLPGRARKSSGLTRYEEFVGGMHDFFRSQIPPKLPCLDKDSLSEETQQLMAQFKEICDEYHTVIKQLKSDLGDDIKPNSAIHRHLNQETNFHFMRKCSHLERALYYSELGDHCGIIPLIINGEKILAPNDHAIGLYLFGLENY